MWLKNWVKRSPVISFFVLVFGIEWFLVLVLSSRVSPVIALLIGSWLPNFIGVFITGIESGEQGLRELFKKAVFWRVSLKWYFIAIFFPILLAFLSIWIFMLLGNSTSNFAPRARCLQNRKVF